MVPFCLIQSVTLSHSPVVKNFIIAAILYMLFVIVDLVNFGN